MKEHQPVNGPSSEDADTSTRPILDLTALEELKLIMDDEFAILLTTFVRDAADRVRELETARSDWTKLRRAAHAFKGSSSNVGALALSDRCLSLEQCCQQAELAQQSISAPEQQEQIGHHVELIKQELAATQEALAHRFPETL